MFQTKGRGKGKKPHAKTIGNAKKKKEKKKKKQDDGQITREREKGGESGKQKRESPDSEKARLENTLCPTKGKQWGFVSLQKGKKGGDKWKKLLNSAVDTRELRKAGLPKKKKRENSETGGVPSKGEG